MARLARLEHMHQVGIAAKPRLTLQLGNLKQLPREYVGDRHVVTVKQLPGDEKGAEWYEFEERPGPPPVSKDLVTNGNNDQIIRVLFVGPRD
jgi:hypothetical protein